MIIYITLMLGCARNTSTSSSVPINESAVSSTESVSDVVSSERSPSEEDLAHLFVQAINENNPDVFLPHMLSNEALYSIEDCTGLSEERQKEEAKKKEEYQFVLQMMKMGMSNSIQMLHQEGYSTTILDVDISLLSTKKKGEIKDEECSLVKDMEIKQMDVRVNKNKESENIEEVYILRLMKIDGVVYAGQITLPTPK